MLDVDVTFRPLDMWSEEETVGCEDDDGCNGLVVGAAGCVAGLDAGVGAVVVCVAGLDVSNVAERVVGVVGCVAGLDEAGGVVCVVCCVAGLAATVCVVCEAGFDASNEVECVVVVDCEVGFDADVDVIDDCVVVGCVAGFGDCWDGFTTVTDGFALSFVFESFDLDKYLFTSKAKEAGGDVGGTIFGSFGWSKTT